MKGIDPVLMLQSGWGADGYIVKNCFLTMMNGKCIPKFNSARSLRLENGWSAHCRFHALFAEKPDTVVSRPEATYLNFTDTPDTIAGSASGAFQTTTFETQRKRIVIYFSACQNANSLFVFPGTQPLNHLCKEFSESTKLRTALQMVCVFCAYRWAASERRTNVSLGHIRDVSCPAALGPCHHTLQLEKLLVHCDGVGRITWIVSKLHAHIEPSESCLLDEKLRKHRADFIWWRGR